MLASSQRLLNSDFISFVSSLSKRFPPKERAAMFRVVRTAAGLGGYSLFSKEASGQFRNLSFQERAVKLKEAYRALSDDELADLTARAAARKASSHKKKKKIELVDLTANGPLSYNAFVKTNYRFAVGASHKKKMRLLATEWRKATRRLKRNERIKRQAESSCQSTFTFVDQ